MTRRTIVRFALIAALAAPPAHAMPRMLTPPDSAHRIVLRRTLDQPGTRLVTRFGPVEYFSAVPSAVGLDCRLPVDPRFGPTSEAHFGWQDVEAIEQYTQPEFARGWRIGSQVGYVGGLIAVIATVRPTGGYLDFLYPFAWALAAVPFGVGGGVVGGVITRFDDGWHPALRFTPSAETPR